jgi:hypothetical protein
MDYQSLRAANTLESGNELSIVKGFILGESRVALCPEVSLLTRRMISKRSTGGLYWKGY